MIKIRPFLNTDPPALAEVINRCCKIESLVSASLLEHAVFSKICFTHDTTNVPPVIQPMFKP